MAQIEIPLTSREVTRQVYQEYAVNPPGFIRRMASLLEQKDPRCLDSLLEGALGIALASYNHDSSGSAQRRLGGSFFRYACSEEEMQKAGRIMPELATFGEPASGGFPFNNETRVVSRRLTSIIEHDDPEIGKMLRELVELPARFFRSENVGAFIHGVDECHRRFKSINTRCVQPAPVDSNPEPSSLPVVRGSIVRAGLLEMILNPHQIATMSKGKPLKLPVLLKRRSRSWQDTERALESFGLTSDFVIYCLEREFQERQEQFPVIQDLSKMYPDPEVERLLQSWNDGELDVTLEERDRILERYRDANLEEIRITNPHLSWGISRLLLSERAPKYLSAAVEGVVSTYAAIREQLSPDTPSLGQVVIMEEVDRPKETVEYQGALHLYAATGTEGSFLAFYDAELDPNRPDRSGWDRFHYIRHGDRLIIYSPEDPEKVVWQGEVVLRDPSGARYDNYGDEWRCIPQQGISLDDWSGCFSNGYSAKLITKQRIKKPQ